MTTAFIEAGVTELSFVGSATGWNDDQVNVPGTAQAGDLAIMADEGTGSGVTAGTPSGWTRVTHIGLSLRVMSIYYKVLSGGDIGAAVTGITGGMVRRQIMAVFRPDEDIESVVTGSVNQADWPGGPPPADQLVAASGQPSPLLIVGGNASDTMTSLPAFDDFIDEPHSTEIAVQLRLGWSIENGTPVNHTISADQSMLESFYIRVD